MKSPASWKTLCAAGPTDDGMNNGGDLTHSPEVFEELTCLSHGRETNGDYISADPPPTEWHTTFRMREK